MPNTLQRLKRLLELLETIFRTQKTSVAKPHDLCGFVYLPITTDKGERR